MSEAISDDIGFTPQTEGRFNRDPDRGAKSESNSHHWPHDGTVMLRFESIGDPNLVDILHQRRLEEKEHEQRIARIIAKSGIGQRAFPPSKKGKRGKGKPHHGSNAFVKAHMTRKGGSRL